MVQTSTLACTHRWILSEPSKGSIAGFCRRCGAQKRYPASPELPPPPEEGEEEEEEEVLDLAELAASIKSMKREVLV